MSSPHLFLFWISTHSPRVGRTYCAGSSGTSSKISTHSPRVGRTVLPLLCSFFTSISTHSPRVGRTAVTLKAPKATLHFNSLAPCGANRIISMIEVTTSPFQLTRPVWGEPLFRYSASAYGAISTHSPRVGRTLLPLSRFQIFDNFNSLAPCGANRMRLSEKQDKHQFQLTRPVWGEPSHCSGIGSTPKFQLTRPVWGEPS